VNEGLQEPKIEEALAELPPEAAPEEAPPAPVWTGPAWLRLAYAFEFLIALIAIFTLWSQVGGQGHMDLLPWYIKLACALSLAWCSVRFTAGIVENPKAWNQHSVVWFIGMIIVAIAMGGITFYYHLHEVPDETDTDDTTQTSVSVPERRPLALAAARDHSLKYGSGSGMAAPSLRGDEAP
jgi:hypothetical protein